MSNINDTIIHLTSELIKMILYKNESILSETYELFGGDNNVTVYLSNYATKTDTKNVSHVNTSTFALKSNLASLKTEVDKLDIHKLVPVPVDFSKLSDVVKNYVVRKVVYDKLVEKVNNIDTSGFVLKTKYDIDKSDLENKIRDTSECVKKLYYNAKITEIENKIPNISGLATNFALTVFEDKIPNATNLVKKGDYDTKSTEVETKLTNCDHGKYITTPEFDNLTERDFTAKLVQAHLITKTDIDDKLKILNQKIKNQTKRNISLLKIN